MMLRTVRARIAVLAALSVTVLLVVVSVALVAVQRHTLTDHVDQGLSDRADEIALQFTSVPPPTVITGLGDEDTLGQVVGPDGTVLAVSDNARQSPALAGPPEGGGDTIRTTRVPVDNARYRLLSRRVDTPRGPVSIHVAASLDDVDETIRVLRRSLAVGVPMVGLLLALLVWWLAGRALRPVEAMRRQVEAMSGGDLHDRVPEPRGNDEIARLAHTMNSMLGRVEASAERQQRFVADASHELRSPLARMRAELEVDLAHPRGSDPAATHRSVLDEAIGMEHLVDDLLELARSDTARIGRADSVDLDDVVLTEAARLRTAGRRTADTTGVSAVQVVGDARQLARAVRNLTDNAERHAASTVWFTSTEIDGEAVLTVSDDGPGIPFADRERIFERFARLDEARSGNMGGGTGLGLAITLAIVEAHGGTVRVESAESGGARFVLTMPAASGLVDDPR